MSKDMILAPRRPRFDGSGHCRRVLNLSSLIHSLALQERLSSN
jgi:hypothetical protein